MDTFTKRLQYIMSCKKIDQAKFAKESGFHKSQVSKWLSGLTETPQQKTLFKLADYFGCNIDWLAEGTGEPFLSKIQQARVGYAALKEQDSDLTHKPEKVVMTIEPGPARKKGGKTEEQQARQETEAIDEDEAIEQTRYVLRSDTVYRGALVSNIRAFYQGVRREEEMAGVDEQMIDMQNKMDMMMQMLESLGAHLPGKKRDAQEG